MGVQAGTTYDFGPGGRNGVRVRRATREEAVQELLEQAGPSARGPIAGLDGNLSGALSGFFGG